MCVSLLWCCTSTWKIPPNNSAAVRFLWEVFKCCLLQQLYKWWRVKLKGRQADRLRTMKGEKEKEKLSHLRCRKLLRTMSKVWWSVRKVAAKQRQHFVDINDMSPRVAMSCKNSMLSLTAKLVNNVFQLVWRRVRRLSDDTWSRRQHYFIAVAVANCEAATGITLRLAYHGSNGEATI